MSDAVTFDPVLWAKRYPEFAALDPDIAQMYFDEATIYWRNDGTSPASTTVIQTLILWKITAHIAALYAQGQGAANPGAAQDASGLVGRISSASEGSVSVSSELGVAPSSSQWYAYFQQTKYGLQFLAMTSQYRTMRYVPGQLQPGGLYPEPQMGVWPYGGFLRIVRNGGY